MHVSKLHLECIQGYLGYSTVYMPVHLFSCECFVMHCQVPHFKLLSKIAWTRPSEFFMMVNVHLDQCLAKDFDANTIKPYRKKLMISLDKMNLVMTVEYGKDVKWFCGIYLFRNGSLFNEQKLFCNYKAIPCTVAITFYWRICQCYSNGQWSEFKK